MKTVILLATYQGERYLPALLDSLSGQTDGDFEVLWQDDGSSDDTVSLLEKYSEKDPRLKKGSEQGRHLGAAGNFLSLLRQTDADIVLLCDQDDIWEPRKVRKLKNAMASAEKEDPRIPLLIHSDCSLIDGDGRPVGESFFRLQGWDPAAVTLNRLLVQNNATGCTMIMNRPLIDLVKACGRAERMFMHDWFIVLTAAAFGKVFFLDEALTRYRQHTGNAIGASRSSLLSRGLKALSQRKKAKERIRLTYTHAQSFMDTYDDRLPAQSHHIVEDYLSTESLPKLRRIRALRRGGYLMQSSVTRLGQIFFG